jgi:ribosomal protein L12E/L44/L45/RPP1/RPP2
MAKPSRFSSGRPAKAIEFDFPSDYRDGEGPDGLKVADDGFGEEKLPNGDPVRWRIVFYKDTINEQELQGISVFAGGKLAQAPFWFELVGGTTAQAGQPYMSGRVEADFLDHKEEDLIATERQRVNWQHEDTQELLVWGKKRMRDLLALWGRRRKEEKQKVLDEKLAPFAERLGRFQPSEQKIVKAALLKIGAVSQINVEQFTTLAESVIVAWENGRLKELIHSVAEARDMPDDSLIEVLVEANVLTALATAEAVKTKLLVVEGLKQRIDKTELENSLRDYIAKHPWLLGPEWETYKKETSPTNLLKEARKQAGLDDPESWPGRLDLALIAGKTLLIVEFMRPGITIDTDHLQRWENYVRIVKTELAGNSGLGFESVQGIIVADKLAKKAHVTDKIKSLNNEGMRALDWPNLLARAGAEWKEYFALLVGRGPDDERLRKLAEEIGIDIPKPVNEAAGATQ